MMLNIITLVSVMYKYVVTNIFHIKKQFVLGMLLFY